MAFINLSQLTKAVKGLVNKINSENYIISSKVGDLSNLDTTDKSNLVAAINEVTDNSTTNYTQLTNKPSINNVTLSGNKTAADLGLAPAGAYVKPNGGIPKTDLASAVQTSLGKADTALQSYTETDPTVPAWAKAATKPTYTASEVGALPDTTLYAGAETAGGPAIITNGIHYAYVDSTSTSTVFTATVTGVTELYDGLTILLKNGVVTSASGFTININSLGAKPVYNNMAAASRETTIFNINYTLLLIYDSTRVDGGCWINYRGYYTDSNTVPTGYCTTAAGTAAKSATCNYGYRDDDNYFPCLFRYANTAANATLAISSYATTAAPIYVNGARTSSSNTFGRGVILFLYHNNAYYCYNDGRFPILVNGAVTSVQEYVATKYTKPSGGIPASDLASGVIPTVPSAYTGTPANLGTASAGSSTSWARGDHVHKMPSASDVGAYALPSGGIPKTDLASAVQTSLGKADTALQSYTETDPTVPSWAKASSKPSYTKSEVGLGNVDNVKQYSASNPPPYPVTSVNGNTGAVTISVPTKTSDLTNDSGFITSADVPEGVAASSTTPKMNAATAVVGTETAFARGDHVHPSDNTKVDKVSGKGLSTNDYTSAEKTKLAGVASGAQANVIESVKRNGTALPITNKAVDVSVPTKTSDLTNDSNFATTSQIDTIVRSEQRTTDYRDQLVVSRNGSNYYFPLGVSYFFFVYDLEQERFTNVPPTEVVDYAHQTVPMVAILDLVSGATHNYYQLTFCEYGGGCSFTYQDDVAVYVVWRNDDNWEFVSDEPGWVIADAGKVDKETGKGLSTNDYTTTEKNKLAGIASSAQVNVIETVKRNGTTLTVTNKAVDISVPTKTSDLTNDSGFGTYSKPSGGIPKADLASAVQTSLGKADTALQTHQTLKTINSNSLVGTGNISIIGLPSVTSSDNGKYLKVVNGAWAAATLPTYNGGVN